MACTGCRPEPDVFEVDFEAAEFAAFVEPDFPFITTSIDARALGSRFPSGNAAVRCLALQLGNDSYACFDTDLLRIAAVWKGDFVSMTGMAQISYNEYGRRNNEIPHILGTPLFGVGMYAGWMTDPVEFRDPRPPGPNPEEPGRGPLSEDLGRWNGVYVFENSAILDYTVAGTRILEQPGSVMIGGEPGLSRTIRTEDIARPLTIALAEVTDGGGSEISGDWAAVFHGPGNDTLTAAAVINRPAGAEFRVTDDRYLTFRIPAGTPASTFRLVVWHGADDGLSQIGTILEEPVEMVDFGSGGPERWPFVTRTRGVVSPDTSAIVIDLLTLPIPNPSQRNVRVVDLDFFPEGRAAVVTFEGDVWIVDGISRNLRNLEWRRYASGLFEPKSIAVVDNEIYVFGREGIVRLHDLNGNGEGDYYENFSNLMAQSLESREFPNHMVRKPGGGFYLAKMAALDMGPRLFPPVIPGLRAGSQHSGSILEVSHDGREIRMVASGFRGPYLGIHPESGMLTASDQEGHFVPTTPIYIVEEGGYYGVSATAHREDLPEPKKPLMWIPHLVDQSGSGQVWVTGGRMGPLDGSLVHLSYGRPGAFRVFMDSTQTAVQGGLMKIPGHYPAPTMKGAVHPLDGQLYITGFLIWGTRAQTPSAFIRMRYTGRESLMPHMLRSGREGIILGFDVELQEAGVRDIANYRMERWEYRRTEQYGSGHFRVDGTPGQEHLPVVASQLSEDGRRILLVVPDMREIMQMQVSYDVLTVDGRTVRDTVYLTVNNVESLDLAGSGFQEIEPDLIAAVPYQLPAEEAAEAVSIARGQQLYQRMGCVACHSMDGSASGTIGPTFHELYMSERPLTDGTTVVADGDYLRQAILEPGLTTVEGFDPGMPSFQGVLTEADLQSIIEFIRSLGSEG